MPSDTSISKADDPRLESWKEIAAYLGCDERTAKRWEKTRGLPVRRLPGRRSGVFAFVSEIAGWRRQGVPVVAAASAAALPEESPQGTQPAAKVPELGVGSHGAASQGFLGPGPEGFLLRHRYAVAAGCMSVLLLAGSLLLFARRLLARNVTAGLPQQQSQVSQHVPSQNAEELYLSGRYFWNKRTRPDLSRARNLFQQAIQDDPSYAAAYVGLADTYFLMVEFAALPPRDAYPPAITAARQAIALDPTMAVAHRSLGFSSFYWDWDRAQSEKEFRKAIELDPHDATAHQWFANTLMTSRRYQEALQEIEEARKLDPTAISIVADRALILSLAGREEESREALLQIEKADPSYLSAHVYLARSYSLDKDDEAYLDELRQIAAITHREADLATYRAAQRGFASAGEEGMYKEIAMAKVTLYRQGLVPAFDVADALARSGRKEDAIGYLKLSYLSRDTQFLTLMGSDVLPTLKGNPDFERLAKMSSRPYREHPEGPRDTEKRDMDFAVAGSL